jgi:translation initiation factor 2A
MCTLAVFVPSIKGAPASVRLYREPNFERPLCNKSFFKAEKIQICWNKQGTACLVSSATETDTTGKSYYGETNL